MKRDKVSTKKKVSNLNSFFHHHHKKKERNCNKYKVRRISEFIPFDRQPRAIRGVSVCGSGGISKRNGT